MLDGKMVNFEDLSRFGDIGVVAMNICKRLEELERRFQPQPQKDQKWYTVNEAAERLRISSKKIREFIKTKRIKRRLGERTIYIPLEELEKFERQSLDY